MNKDLLREREAFKRKAMAVHDRPGSAKKEKTSSSSSSDKKRDSDKAPKSQSAQAKLELAKLKQMGGTSTSQFKFGVLTKLVRYMRQRHMEGEDHPLTLEAMLDETSQLDIGSKIKYWLETEALKSNPKISASTGPSGMTTYMFKPPYNIANRKGLLKLLKQHHIKGMGGIFLEDVQESLPNCDKAMRILQENGDVWLITRPVDKKKVLFYHNSTDDFEVDEEFAKLWRSVAVDSMDDVKIDEYLEKQGIQSMKDQGLKKPIIRKPIKRNINRKKRAPKDNVHIAEDLEDYSELTAESHKK